MNSEYNRRKTKWTNYFREVLLKNIYAWLKTKLNNSQHH